MDKIIYFKEIDKSELEKNNILVEDDCEIADGVILHSGVCVVSHTVLEEDVEVFGYSVIADSHIGKGSVVRASFVSDSNVGLNVTIGPFAHIRNGCEIGNNVRVGNFVEIKNSKIGNGCKMAHLAYVGDAEIGNDCNIGCGVIFCNYNGKEKQKTYVGDRVFIGSNANLIAPVTICDNAYIAAGSTINKDVDVEELAIARARQVNKKNFNNPYTQTF